MKHQQKDQGENTVGVLLFVVPVSQGVRQGRGKKKAHAKHDKLYESIFGRLEWKPLLGGPSLEEQDNRHINLKETGCENMKWIHRVRHEERWLAFVDTVMNFDFHKTQDIY